MSFWHEISAQNSGFLGDLGIVSVLVAASKTRWSYVFVCFQASSDVKPPVPDPTFNRRCSLLVSEVSSVDYFSLLSQLTSFGSILMSFLVSYT